MDEVLKAALEESPVGRKPPAPPAGTPEGEAIPPAAKKPGEVRV
jgi:ATP-dependent Lon protease